MQTSGMALLAVERCSPVRVWTAAQDSRSAHGLLYFAAVRDDRHHQIRRSGEVVQDCSSMVVGWAVIPELSTCVECCSAAWLQSWLQSRRNGADPRPSAFQAGHIPSWRGSCERCALSLLAATCRWSQLLLSPLRSTRRGPSGSKPTRTMQGMARVRSGQAPAWPLV
jgi:hypothetical protein